MAELTKDHIIPRALFTKPLPALITVPACDNCNAVKSRDDDFLRDLLTTDLYGSQHPTAQKIFNGKVLRSQRRNSSQLAKDIVSNSRVQPLYTKAGIYLGNFPQCSVDSERLNRIFERMIRGLYYSAQKQRIPDDYTFELLRYDPWDFKRAWKTVQDNLNPNGPLVLGNIFGCAYVMATEDQFHTWWLLEFYGGVCFSVSTQKPSSEG